MNINLACGEKLIEGCLNVDFRPTSITDKIHDLTVMPWPFKDEEFGDAYALDIIEHMLYVVPFVNECWRIIRPGGHLYIRTTYFMAEQGYADPTHLHYFTHESFDFFDPETDKGQKYQYSDKKWRVLDRALSGYELVFNLEKIGG